MSEIDETRALIRLAKRNWLHSVCELNIAYAGEHAVLQFDDAMDILAREEIGWFDLPAAT